MSLFHVLLYQHISFFILLKTFLENSNVLLNLYNFIYIYVKFFLNCLIELSFFFFLVCGKFMNFIFIFFLIHLILFILLFFLFILFFLFFLFSLILLLFFSFSILLFFLILSKFKSITNFSKIIYILIIKLLL